MPTRDTDWCPALDARPAGGKPLTLGDCEVWTWLITIEPGRMWQTDWRGYGRLTLRIYEDRITLERGRMWPEQHPEHQEDDGA